MKRRGKGARNAHCCGPGSVLWAAAAVAAAARARAGKACANNAHFLSRGSKRIRASTARLSRGSSTTRSLTLTRCARGARGPARDRPKSLPPPRTLTLLVPFLRRGGGQDGSSTRRFDRTHGGAPVLLQGLAGVRNRSPSRAHKHDGSVWFVKHAGAQSGGDGLDGGCASFPCSWAAVRCLQCGPR